MDVIVSFSQLVLGAVFAVAACAKLVDRRRFRETLESFGVPRPLAGPGAIVIPLLELAVGAALFFAPTARVGALAALVLLAIFSTAIVRLLRSDTKADCNCFGGIAQTEVGRGALIRNGALAAIAVLVLIGGPSVGALQWLTPAEHEGRPLFASLVVCIAALGCFCWALLRQNGRLLRRLEDEPDERTPARAVGPSVPLEVGASAPGFDGLDLLGERISLDSLLARGLPVGIFFTDPGCGACELVLDTVGEVQRERADQLMLAVLSAGSIERVSQKAVEFGLAQVVPRTDDAILDAFGIQGFPAFVEIDAAGKVAAPIALGADPVRAALLRPRPAGSPKSDELVLT